MEKGLRCYMLCAGSTLDNYKGYIYLFRRGHVVFLWREAERSAGEQIGAACKRVSTPVVGISEQNLVPLSNDLTKKMSKELCCSCFAKGER